VKYAPAAEIGMAQARLYINNERKSLINRQEEVW